MAVVSIKRHRMFDGQAHGARSGLRLFEVPATDQDSHRRGRSKRGGNALTKESVPTQYENRAHQIPLPSAMLMDRSFLIDPIRPKAEPGNKSSGARTSGIGFAQ